VRKGNKRKKVFILMALLVLAFLPNVAGASCGGFGDPDTDWIVSPCRIPAVLETPNLKQFVLRNGIVSRTLDIDPNTKALSTSSLISEVTGDSMLMPSKHPLAEAEMVINSVPVLVGGPNASVRKAGSVQLVFSGYRQSTSLVAGNFSFTPGVRSSRGDRAWPPKGIRVEFDHTAPCHAESMQGLAVFHYT
jgi:hypothetical protein